MTSLLSLRNDHQQSDNDLLSCNFDNQRAVQKHQSIIKVLVAFKGMNGSYEITTTSCKWVSKEQQQFFIFYLGQSMGYAIALTYNQCIGILYGQT